MTPATRNRIVRLILQVLSVIMGLFGTFCVYMGIRFALAGLSPGESLALVLAVVFLAIGGFLVFVAYQTIMRFSYIAIRNFCIVVALFVLTTVSSLLRPLTEQAWENGERLRWHALSLLPILLAILLYKLATKMLPKLAGEGRDQR